MEKSEMRIRSKRGCKQHALKLDIYKESFKLQLPDQVDKYRTMCGAILSVITILLLLAYAIYKVDLLIRLKDYRVQQATSTDFYRGNDGFGRKDGFAFAAGIVEWDDGTDVVEDPAYG